MSEPIHQIPFGVLLIRMLLVIASLMLELKIATTVFLLFSH